MLVAVCLLAALAEKLDEGKVARAKVDAQTIEKAVKVYYTQNGKWPDALDDVAGLFMYGKKDLIDQWGQAYRFEVRRAKGADGKEVETPYIWTERVVNGKTEVYGNKPPEKKKDDKKP